MLVELKNNDSVSVASFRNQQNKLVVSVLLIGGGKVLKRWEATDESARYTANTVVRTSYGVRLVGNRLRGEANQVYAAIQDSICAAANK